MTVDLPFGPPPSVRETADSLRRKLQILWQRADYIVLAYGGMQITSGSSVAGSLGTAWELVPGWDVIAPAKEVDVQIDLAQSQITIDEAGVFFITSNLYFDGQNGRTVDVGLRINGVDPSTAYFSFSFSGQTTTASFSTNSYRDIVVDGSTLQLVWRASQAGTSYDIHSGNFQVQRVDYL